MLYPAGYAKEAAGPQAQQRALTTSIALRDCALRYEPKQADGAGGSLTDASPVAAAMLIGGMHTCMAPTAPVRHLQ